jgi:hypothetical protein
MMNRLKHTVKTIKLHVFNLELRVPSPWLLKKEKLVRLQKKTLVLQKYRKSLSVMQSLQSGIQWVSCRVIGKKMRNHNFWIKKTYQCPKKKRCMNLCRTHLKENWKASKVVKAHSFNSIKVQVKQIYQV